MDINKDNNSSNQLQNILIEAVVINNEDAKRGGVLEVKDANTSECVPVYPLLPNYIHSVPKIGERVFVIPMKVKQGTSKSSLLQDGFWVGPIASDLLNRNDHTETFDANRRSSTTEKLPDITDEEKNLLPSLDDIAILGKLKTDIYQTKEEIILRSGIFENEENKVFNKKTISYIQIKNKKREITGFEEVEEEKVVEETLEFAIIAFLTDSDRIPLTNRLILEKSVFDPNTDYKINEANTVITSEEPIDPNVSGATPDVYFQHPSLEEGEITLNSDDDINESEDDGVNEEMDIDENNDFEDTGSSDADDNGTFVVSDLTVTNDDLSNEPLAFEQPSRINQSENERFKFVSGDELPVEKFIPRQKNPNIPYTQVEENNRVIFSSDEKFKEANDTTDLDTECNRDPITNDTYKKVGIVFVYDIVNDEIIGEDEHVNCDVETVVADMQASIDKFKQNRKFNNREVKVIDNSRPIEDFNLIQVIKPEPFSVEEKTETVTVKRPLINENNEEFRGYMNIVSNEIFLLSHEGIEKLKKEDNEVKINENKILISDVDQARIKELTEPIVNGNVLIEFLTNLRDYVINHKHQYNLTNPIANESQQNVVNFDLDRLINKNIRTK